MAITTPDRPVYLYVKRHLHTGLLYFGKTVVPDPNKYSGSGTHWGYHLNEHGFHIETVMFEKFEDDESLKEFADFFSIEFDIVQSDRWANRIPETGVDVPWSTLGMKHSKESLKKMSVAQSGENNPNWGKPKSEETKLKISLAQKGIPKTEDHNIKVSIGVKNAYKEGRLVSPFKYKNYNGFYGKTHTQETLDKISKAKTGIKIKHKDVICPHCNKVGASNVMSKWHFDNCKVINPDRNPNRKDRKLTNRYWNIQLFDGSIIKVASLTSYCKDNNIPYQRFRANRVDGYIILNRDDEYV